MELLAKLEKTVAGWLKNVPHLPQGVRTWIGENVWWIVAIGTIISAIGVLGLLSSVFTSVGLLSSPVASYYASASFASWLIVTGLVSLVFVALECFIMALAIVPLKEKQKKGWVLLFAAWAVSLLFTIVSAALTLNFFSIIGNLIFGAIWAAVSAYFIFEIHDEFAHVERSKGVKAKKTAKV